MKRNSISLLVLLALGLLLSCARTPRQLVFEKPGTPMMDLASERGRNSTVRVVSWVGSGIGKGSSFFVDTDKIATNIHVIAHSGPVFVKFPNKEKN